MVHIVSWNVAGWMSTAARIRQHFGSIFEYFGKLHADIICLQETKLRWGQIEDDSINAGACEKGMDVSVWESFWVCCERSRGGNGVAVFAKRGVVHSVDYAPLCNKEFNAEGRCIALTTSHFVLVNVYVPYAKIGQGREDAKSKFLSLLRSAMERLRALHGLPVILCGDLNVSYRIEDVHWIHRNINLKRFLELMLASEQQQDSSRKNSRSGPILDEESWLVVSHRIMWYLKGNTAPVVRVSDDVTQLERDGSRNLYAEQHNNLVYEAAGEGTETNSSLVKIASSMPIATAAAVESYDDRSRAVARIKQLLVKGGALNPDGSVEYILAESLTIGNSTTNPINKAISRASWAAGDVPHSCAMWLRRLIEEDGFVDTLLYPAQQQDQKGATTATVPRRQASSFTSWNQATNRRSDNEGNRIDYILSDRSLLAQWSEEPFHEESPSPLTSHETVFQQWDDAFSGEVAKEAKEFIMGYGRYPVAPLSGEGMPELPKIHSEWQLEGQPRTGVVCTPPQYSDHIAVTCYMPRIHLGKRVGELSKKSLFHCYRPPQNVLDMLRMMDTAKKTTIQQKKRERCEIDVDAENVYEI